MNRGAPRASAALHFCRIQARFGVTRPIVRVKRAISKRRVSPPHRERSERKDQTERCEQAAETRTDRIEAAAEITAAEFLVDRLAGRNGRAARTALADRAVVRVNAVDLLHVKIPASG